MADHRGRIITLGMFIIDSFATLDDKGKEVMTDHPDELGGAGTYAILGARMFESSASLGMVIHYSPDSLPQDGDLYKRLLNYGEEMWEFRDRKLENEEEERGCTRGLNIYSGDHVRGFRYLTPPLLLTPKSIQTLAGGGISRLVTPYHPAVVHAISSPKRTETVCDEIDAEWGQDVKVLWEPVPPSCAPEHRQAFMEATRRVDIVSPNHTEAFQLLSMITGDDVRGAIEKATQQLAAMRPKLAAVVRSGALGACYAASGSTETQWVDAYWQETDANHVNDPTGAGNAFMGGLAAGLYAGEDLTSAMEHATVAAGFTVQQSGPPAFEDGLWNGDSPRERLKTFRARKNQGSL